MYSRIPDAIATIRDMFSNNKPSPIHQAPAPINQGKGLDIAKLSLEELGLSAVTMRYDSGTEILPQVKLNAFYAHYHIDPKSPTLYESLLTLVSVSNWDYSQGNPSLCDIEQYILEYRVA